jgi:hypothetical protein
MNAAKPAFVSLRFTLRELFLAILAVAAFLGWGLMVYRDANRQRTPFFNSVDWGTEVLDALRDFGESQYPHQEEWFGIRGNGDGYCFCQYRIALAPQQYDSFMKATSKRVQDKIAANDCIVDHHDIGFEEDGGQWFAVDYHRNSIAGSAQFRLAPSIDGKVKLRILAFEGRKL